MKKKTAYANGYLKKNQKNHKPVEVAHACNSSYSEGRDWEDFGSRPV
jgi:hypothetical protein